MVNGGPTCRERVAVSPNAEPRMRRMSSLQMMQDQAPGCGEPGQVLADTGFGWLWRGHYIYTHTYIHIYIYIDSGCNIILFIRHVYHRRKFRSQTSDNMDRWKAEMERVREKRKIRREKSRRERVRRKKMQMREKVGKSRNTVFFQWFVAPKGRKVGSLKRRVRSQLARWEMKNCTPFWREAHFQVKMYKTHQLRTTFTSWDVEKVHAVVARSTFPSQNVQNTRGADHFWQLRCRKSARRCGAKHISKSKCSKWVRTTFGSWDVEKVHAVVARSTFRSQNVQNTRGSDQFWRLSCRKSARHCGAKHISKWKCSKHWGSDHFWRFRRRFASLHCTTLHYTPVHSTTLNYTTPHYITLHYAPLHSTSHYTTLHPTTLHYTILHYLPLHFTTLHYTTLHYTTTTTTQLDSTTLHSTPLH